MSHFAQAALLFCAFFTIGGLLIAYGIYTYGEKQNASLRRSSPAPGAEDTAAQKP